MESRSPPVLVVRINVWKVCLSRVPWFSTDSTTTRKDIVIPEARNAFE